MSAPKITPHPGPQTKFLASGVREVGYGGQAGGGKSYALILDALHQLGKPNYNAILFRRTYKQLREADGLIDLSRQVYPNLGGVYNQSTYTWTFPLYHNNTIRLSHLQHETDVEGFSGAQYAYIGFDELQNFTERQYLFLFSRNRCSNPDVTPFVRSTFNPGGIGHRWIKTRFITPFKLSGDQFEDKPRYYKGVSGKDTETDSQDRFSVSRLFIPARLEDNPSLWRDGKGDYEAGLHQLSEVDFRRLRYGDWDVKLEGLVYYAFTDDNIISDQELDYGTCVYYIALDFGAINESFGLYAYNGQWYTKVFEAMIPQGTTQQRADFIKNKIRPFIAEEIEDIQETFPDLDKGEVFKAAWKNKVIGGYGGSKSETQIRREYSACGIQLKAPVIQDVATQIRQTNDLFADKKLMVLDTMSLFMGEANACQYDDKGNIVDKNSWHHLDETRYLGAGVSRTRPRIL
jgi:hypothetical protein